MSEPAYLRPKRLEDAVAALAAQRLTVLAGGTDYYAGRVGRTLDEPILDITAVEGLRGIREAHGHWRIGATTTWTDLVREDLPALFRGLQSAAREIGGQQVQNTGTVAGNLCNASPAADGVPALLALDASVELVSSRGVRTLPLAQFIEGNRRTARTADELMTAVLVPSRSHRSRSAFLKLGHRRYLVISVVMVSVALDCDADGTVDYAGVAVGACSPVAQRLTGLESRLVGQPAGESLAEQPEATDLQQLSPIDDLRGSGAYRLDAALTLVRRALREAGTALHGALHGRDLGG